MGKYTIEELEILLDIQLASQNSPRTSLVSVIAVLKEISSILRYEDFGVKFEYIAENIEENENFKKAGLEINKEIVKDTLGALVHFGFLKFSTYGRKEEYYRLTERGKKAVGILLVKKG